MKLVQRGFLAAALVCVCAIFVGCGTASAEVSLVKVELQEWPSPDGKTYLLAVPTWSVTGDQPVAEVYAIAVAKGPNGEWEAPATEKPLYRGDVLDPGTTFHPTNLPEEALILGPSEEVLKKTGPNPLVEMILWGSSTLTPEADTKQEDPP